MLRSCPKRAHRYLFESAGDHKLDGIRLHGGGVHGVRGCDSGGGRPLHKGTADEGTPRDGERLPLGEG
eukprot:1176201-Prorocentrum_minimum.AAC.1